MVHQHFLLAEAMTVAENVALGMRTSPLGWRFDQARIFAETERLASQTGLHIDPRARVCDLSVGLRQRVEIIKALSRGAKILLLDEPTAVLAPPEVESLFQTLRALRDSGRTIMIVTHKLDEVFALASSVTVLRSGETVFSGALNTLTPPALAEKMIGRSLPQLPITPLREVNDATALVLSRVRIPGTLEIDRLAVKCGEIVGVAGVEGNGQQELAAVIAGTFDVVPDGMELSLNGRSISRATVAERTHAGLALIPADRQREALVLEMTLNENLHLREPLTRRRAGVAFLDHAAMSQRSRQVLQDYSVSPPDENLAAHALSGGNQQKVVIARELSPKPRLIVALNPTRGLDVGAASEVHTRLLKAARESEAGVLLISSDLDEVLTLSDRVAVLFRGRMTELGLRGVSKHEVGKAMVGAQS